jgi:hypothetical protein
MNPAHLHRLIDHVPAIDAVIHHTEIRWGAVPSATASAARSEGERDETDAVPLAASASHHWRIES